MTVGNKLHQTLASLRSAKADMETFALETQDKKCPATLFQWGPSAGTANQ